MMKKGLFLILALLVSISMLSCRSNNQAIKTIVSSYQHMNNLSIEDTTEYDDGAMLGDAYYVIGSVNQRIESVNHYMGEFIYLVIEFGDETIDDTISIERITVEYCDYEKEVFISSIAFDDDNPYVIQGISYQDLFDQIENLSIQDLRYVLEEIDLL